MKEAEESKTTDEAAIEVAGHIKEMVLAAITTSLVGRSRGDYVAHLGAAIDSAIMATRIVNAFFCSLQTVVFQEVNTALSKKGVEGRVDSEAMKKAIANAVKQADRLAKTCNEKDRKEFRLMVKMALADPEKILFEMPRGDA